MLFRGFGSAAVLAAVLTAPAAAERPEDTIWLRGGAFFNSVDSRLKVDSPSLGIPGTEIDFEQDLDFDKRTTVPKIEGGIRLGERLRVEGDYFSLSRTGGAAINEKIQIGDTSFPVDAEMAARLKTQIWRIAVGWSPVKTERAEFGGALGVHLAHLKYSFVADVDGIILSQARSHTAPFPNVTLYGSYNLGKVINLNARIDAFALKLGAYKGSLIDAQASVAARLQRNIGVGAGYRYVDYKLRITEPDYGLRADYRYHGPFAFAELAF